MLKINCDKLNIKETVQSIKQCALGKDALILENILQPYQKSDFARLLIDNVGFRNDNRQINIKNNVEKTVWWPIFYNQKKDFVYTHSKTRQPLHNDNAWFSDPAEMVFLIFEKQASQGGKTTIYKIDRILNDLEKYEKNLLADLQCYEVIIKKDDSGKFFNKTTILRNDCIYWNYYRIQKTNKDIKLMCDQFFKFLDAREKTKSVEKVKCKTNDIFCFNDTKMLHGRTSFIARNKNDRIVHQSMWYIK